jgi:hypothetical protein
MADSFRPFKINIFFAIYINHLRRLACQLKPWRKLASTPQRSPEPNNPLQILIKYDADTVCRVKHMMNEWTKIQNILQICIFFDTIILTNLKNVKREINNGNHQILL